MCEDGHCKEDEKFSVLTYVGETNIHTHAHTHIVALALFSLLNNRLSAAGCQ